MGGAPEFDRGQHHVDVPLGLPPRRGPALLAVLAVAEPPLLEHEPLALPAARQVGVLGQPPLPAQPAPGRCQRRLEVGRAHARLRLRGPEARD